MSAIVLWGAAGSASAQAGFTTIDHLGYAVAGAAQDCTPDGATIVGVVGGRVYRWTEATGLEFLSDSNDQHIFRAQISSDGTTIVSNTFDPGSGAYGAGYWTEPTSWVPLGGLPWSTIVDGAISSGWGVSGDGAVVTGFAWVAGARAEAFRWTESTGMVSLGTPSRPSASLPFGLTFIDARGVIFVFSAWISPAEADQYIAGCIILAAAPCTAMVFVWSYLTDGDPAYTLVQVSVNDLIMLVLFAPIVRFLVSGASSLDVPFRVLLYAVAIFIVVPLAVGTILRQWFIRRHGLGWFEQTLLPRFAPVSMTALLATLVLIFGFQADNITGKYLHVLLIAVPILIQVYFNSSLAYGLLRFLRVPHSVAAPGALIGASNFFELAVATAIALFGPGSGAALATVVGVLIEVPVMLSVCSVCNRTRHWFVATQPAS